MTRLHDAFDDLVDRGDPVGSDILLARARDAVARGAVAELQPSPPGNRTRLRVVIAALCVAVVAGIALVSRRYARRRTTPSRSTVAVCARTST